jgi:hypothetical protein
MRQYILANLWMYGIGPYGPKFVRIDFISPDGLFCRTFAPNGAFSHLFFIRHEHAQQSYLESPCEFVQRPDWAPPDHKPWTSEVKA